MIRPTAHRIFAAASVAAAGLHIASILAAGLLTPDYSQNQRAISDLGAYGQPYASLVNYLGLAVPGVLILLAALSAHKMWASRRVESTTSPAPRLGLRCMAGAGVFLLVAGIYPFPSLKHLTSALLAGFSAAVSILSFSVYTRKHTGSSVLVVSGFTVALLVLIDASTWVLAETQNFRAHAFMGLQQRIASFSAFVWFSAFAAASARHNSLINR